MSRTFRLLLAAGCIGLLAAVPNPARKAYEDGTTAYRAGHYEQALRAFEAAERLGLHDPNLTLNLGLTHYQLGHDSEARQRFNAVRTDLRYTAIADYHLGLIDLRRGERDAAFSRFESVRAMPDSEGLGAFAASAMRRLDDAPPPPAPEDTSRRSVDYLRTAAGFDSNPELVGEVDRPAAGPGAAYAELLGAIEHPIIYSGIGTTLLSADLGVRQYGSSEGFDHQSGDLGLAQAWDIGFWRFQAGASGGAAWLGGESYENTRGASFDAREPLGEATLLLRYDGQRIAGEREFAYLDGWRHRAGVEISRPFGRVRGRAALDLEHNARRDLAAGREFSSYSPTRLGLTGVIASLPMGRATLEWRGRLRASRYPDADRFLDAGGNLEAARRADRLASTGVRARYRMGERWNWLLDYAYSRNASNIAAFDYARHEATLGIEFLR